MGQTENQNWGCKDLASLCENRALCFSVLSWQLGSGMVQLNHHTVPWNRLCSCFYFQKLQQLSGKGLSPTRALQFLPAVSSDCKSGREIFIIVSQSWSEDCLDFPLQTRSLKCRALLMKDGLGLDPWMTVLHCHCAGAILGASICRGVLLRSKSPLNYHNSCD